MAQKGERKAVLLPCFKISKGTYYLPRAWRSEKREAPLEDEL